jgi:outer membrane protein assembly factor BamB
MSSARRTVLSAILPAALCLLAGCESGGPTVKAGPQRTPEQRRADFPISYEDYGRLGYRPTWVGYPAITGSLPVTFFQPYDDLTAVLEQGSTVSILEPTTGARRCSVTLSNPITKFTGIAREENRLLVSSDADVFVIDTQTCNVTARQRIEKIVSTEPAHFGNLLIFGTPTGEVLAHMSSAAIPGVKIWGFGMNGGIERNPVLIGPLVGAVSQTGDVVFLNAQNGASVGRNKIFGGLATNPVADDQLMYVASQDQSVYAFNPEGGALVWRYRTALPLRTQPTVYGGRLYVGIPGEGLVAFDSATGGVAWKAKGLDDTVIVAAGKNRLIGFDAHAQMGYVIGPELGDVIERVKMPGVAKVKADKFEGGNLYAVSTSGVVAKFQPK